MLNFWRNYKLQIWDCISHPGLRSWRTFAHNLVVELAYLLHIRKYEITDEENDGQIEKDSGQSST